MYQVFKVYRIITEQNAINISLHMKVHMRNKKSVLVSSEYYFKLCLFIHKNTCENKWQSPENSDANTDCTFLKTCEVDIWSL